MTRTARQPLALAAFTLVEAVMSMLIVSVLLVCAMRTTAGAGLIQYKTAERTAARFLADGLMTDITSLPYEDPLVTPVFGPEPGESTTSKVAWDDIDDFNGWSESPPQERDGTVMPNLSGWQRSVAVAWVVAANPSQTSASETGAKRITVTIRHNGLIVATRVAVRTKVP